MIMKGLPEEYKTFSTVISQRDNVTFSDFKSSLRSFEETEKAKTPNSSNIMTANFKKTLRCYSCGMQGHKKVNCRRKKNFRKTKYCVNCKNNTHSTQNCRRRNNYHQVDEQNMQDDQHDSEQSDDHFSFNFSDYCKFDYIYQNNLLVDSGSTSHIVNDFSKFVSFENNFKPECHYVVLADDSKTSNIVKK